MVTSDLSQDTCVCYSLKPPTISASRGQAEMKQIISHTSDKLVSYMAEECRAEPLFSNFSFEAKDVQGYCFSHVFGLKFDPLDLGEVKNMIQMQPVASGSCNEHWDFFSVLRYFEKLFLVQPECIIVCINRYIHCLAQSSRCMEPS